MGVKGLWTLLEPVGKPVTLESLEGKVLAVDVSIWLHQTVHGMRDAHGDPVANAHLVGLFNRVCKLLFYKIRPVFVFDGGVPELKRQTLASRRQLRADATTRSEEASRKLLTKVLKQHAIGSMLTGDGVAAGPSGTGLRSSATSKTDMYQLPPMPEAETDNFSFFDDEVERTLEVRATFLDMLTEEFQDPEDIDPDSADFQELPSELQYELLKELKEYRKRKRWNTSVQMPEATEDFSKFQIKRMMNRCKLTQRLDGVRKEINAHASGDVVRSLTGSDPGEGVESQRLVSDESATYVLIRGLKKNPENAQKLKVLNDIKEEEFEETGDAPKTKQGAKSDVKDIVRCKTEGDAHQEAELESIWKASQADTETLVKPKTLEPILRDNPEYLMTDGLNVFNPTNTGNSDVERESSPTGATTVTGSGRESSPTGKTVVTGSGAHLEVVTIDSNSEESDCICIDSDDEASNPTDSKAGLKVNEEEVIDITAGHDRVLDDVAGSSAEGGFIFDESSSDVDLVEVDGSASKDGGSTNRTTEELNHAALAKSSDKSMNKFADVNLQLCVNLDSSANQAIEQLNHTTNVKSSNKSNNKVSNVGQQLHVNLDSSANRAIKELNHTTNVRGSDKSKNRDASVDLQLNVRVSCPDVNTVENQTVKAKDTVTTAPEIILPIDNRETTTLRLTSNMDRPAMEENSSQADNILCPKTQQISSPGKDLRTADAESCQRPAQPARVTSPVNRDVRVVPASSPSRVKAVQPPMSPISIGSSSSGSDGDDFEVVPVADDIALQTLYSPLGRRRVVESEARVTHVTGSDQERSSSSSSSPFVIDIDTEDTEIEDTETANTETADTETPNTETADSDTAGIDIVDIETPATETANTEAVTDTQRDSERPTTSKPPQRPTQERQEALEAMQTQLEAESQTLEEERGRLDRQAASITDIMTQEAQELLRLFGVPYIVSPMEAEAQCAYLDQTKQTAGTVTDDSDIWLFGGQHVYKNMFNQGKYVEHYSEASLRAQLLLDRFKLINLAFLCGSDYTPGIERVGPVTAMEILAEFPGDGLQQLRNLKTWWNQNRSRAVPSPTDTNLKKRLRQLKLPSGFPSARVSEAYLKPEVDVSEDRFTWGKPNLDLLREYATQKLGWPQSKTDEFILPVMKKLSEGSLQKHITSFFNVDFGEPRKLKSKRVMNVLNKLQTKRQSVGVGDESSAMAAEDTEETRPHTAKVVARTITESSTSSSKSSSESKTTKRPKAMATTQETASMAKRARRGSARGRGRGRARGRTQPPQASAVGRQTVDEVNLSESSSDEE